MTILRGNSVGTILTLTISFLMIGCGGESVIVNPDFSHPDLRSSHLKRDSVRIVKVSDGRPIRSSQIGTARVGVFNRQVPYILNGDVAEVVRTMLDTLIVGNHDQDRFVPVSVSVDMFEVGENMKLFAEEGYFACNLRFNFPVTPDSMGHQVVFVKQTDRNAVDATDAIEPLIYNGMAECARTFVEETLDKNHNIMAVSSDSADVIKARDSLRVAVHQERRNTEPKSVTLASSTQLKTNELSFHYVQGDKIQTGIRASYSMLSQAKDSQFLWGLGIGLTYYDIVNNQDLVKGNFISFGGRLVGKYYFGSAPTTAYLGGNLGLAGGTERISYGTRDETTFFFGPTIEEILGFSVARRVSFEIGSFQLAHFGSKLLPSDIGFVAGLSFGL